MHEALAQAGGGSQDEIDDHGKAALQKGATETLVRTLTATNGTPIVSQKPDIEDESASE